MIWIIVIVAVFLILFLLMRLGNRDKKKKSGTTTERRLPNDAYRDDDDVRPGLERDTGTVYSDINVSGGGTGDDSSELRRGTMAEGQIFISSDLMKPEMAEPAEEKKVVHHSETFFGGDHANGGSVWRCSYCDSETPADQNFCCVCGAERQN
jgi:hypothetical protein